MEHVSILPLHLHALRPGCRSYNIITPSIDPFIFLLNFTEHCLLIRGHDCSIYWRVSNRSPPQTHPHYISPTSSLWHWRCPLSTWLWKNSHKSRFIDQKLHNSIVQKTSAVDHFYFVYSNLLLEFIRRKMGHNSILFIVSLVNFWKGRRMMNVLVDL